ncbi:response regulator transcription factor [Rhizobium sp. H4]|uniref:response regulator transcription factor n=1 Tax=Rhizobium sp. H4 TaxID=2035449 RepID=UPI001FE06A4C|nr:response regulator transcription factor [Rhizobium sp. H4]
MLAHILHGEGFEARLAVSDDDVVGACTAAEIAAVLLDCAGWPSDVAPLCALLKNSGVSVGALISGGMRAQHLQLRPLSPSKLLAFLHAAKRRLKAVTLPSSAVLAEFVFEPHAVVVSGKRVALAPLEIRILRFMLEWHGEISTRMQVIEAAWPDPHAVETRTVDVHIGRLRKAFTGRSNLRILSVYGAGYILECRDG